MRSVLATVPTPSESASAQPYPRPSLSIRPTRATREQPDPWLTSFCTLVPRLRERDARDSVPIMELAQYLGRRTV